MPHKGGVQNVPILCHKLHSTVRCLNFTWCGVHE